MAGKVLLAQDVSESGKNLLREKGFEVILAPDEQKSTIKALIADCDAVFSKTLFLDEEILSAGKKLKVVGKHGVGIDNVVDIEVATRLGIYVVNAPYANIESVAEHTVAAILALAKHVVDMNHAVRQGDFDAPARIINIDVKEKVLGLVGLGNIGKLVAKKAHYGFDMKIIGYDPYAAKEMIPDYIELVEDMDEIFRAADFVSIHVNGSPKTANLVNKDKLQLMKPTAFFINFARGIVVNEEDLIDALKNGTIKGAALDVFATEPVEIDNPLLQMSNVLLSPHCSALSTEACNRMSYDGCMGIVEILQGRTPTWCVNYNEVNAKQK